MESKHTAGPWQVDLLNDDPMTICGPDNPNATKPSEEYNECRIIARFYGPDAAANRDAVIERCKAYDEMLEGLGVCKDIIELAATDRSCKAGLGASEWEGFLTDQEKAIHRVISRVIDKAKGEPDVS